MCPSFKIKINYFVLHATTYSVMLACAQCASWPAADRLVRLAHTVQVARVACSGTRHTNI